MSENDTARQHPGDGAATTYFVVAMKRKPDAAPSEKVVPCLYFDVHGNKQDAKHLETTHGHHAIRFQQCPSLPPGFVPSGDEEVDPDVGLVAAVVDTLRQCVGRPESILALGWGNTAYLKVPVEPGHRRGVVLVFRRPAVGESETLIATTDPEVRNGSGTPEGG